MLSQCFPNSIIIVTTMLFCLSYAKLVVAFVPQMSPCLHEIDKFNWKSIIVMCHKVIHLNNHFKFNHLSLRGLPWCFNSLPTNKNTLQPMLSIAEEIFVLHDIRFFVLNGNTFTLICAVLVSPRRGHNPLPETSVAETIDALLLHMERTGKYWKQFADNQGPVHHLANTYKCANYYYARWAPRHQNCSLGEKPRASGKSSIS